jgi:hypothetical protein
MYFQLFRCPNTPPNALSWIGAASAGEVCGREFSELAAADAPIAQWVGMGCLRVHPELSRFHQTAGFFAFRAIQ